MKTMSKLGLSCLLAAFMALGAMGRSAAPAVLKAHADIAGAPGSGISGTAVFIQIGTGILPTVQVIVTVEGLAPGSKHGFHIHENGDCGNAFAAAGGHFDPGPFGNSTPPDTNHPFHMGDLPNLKADSHGRATFITTTSRITLSDGPLTIFDAAGPSGTGSGSSVIVHALEDQGTTGVANGAGGGRIACGVIEAD